MPDAAQSLSIILPACNEADNIEAAVEDAFHELAKLTRAYDVVVIDDASTDETYEKLKALQAKHPQLTIYRNQSTIGCHPSTLIGFPLAKGDYRLFLPADRQIRAAMLSRFVEKAQSSGADVIYSWRQNRADPVHRRLLGRLYNGLLRCWLKLPVHDADSASMLSRKAVDAIIPDIRADSAFISVEILLAAQQAGLSIAEVVIEHEPRIAGQAKGVNLKDALRVPWDMVTIGWWLWRQQSRGKKRP